MIAALIILGAAFGIITGLDAKTTRRFPASVQWAGSICVAGAIILGAFAK
jgi:uncharacterized membrane protein